MTVNLWLTLFLLFLSLGVGIYLGVKSVLSPRLPNSWLQFALFVAGSVTLWCFVILIMPDFSLFKKIIISIAGGVWFPAMTVMRRDYFRKQIGK
jgi:hypothetical protein